VILGERSPKERQSFPVCLINGETAEDAANARLVTAAPDLLEACKMALPRFEKMEAGDAKLTTRFLRAAIAKAEGRS
jgi:hypothetical protein